MIDVRAIRLSLHLTQQQFADRFHFNLLTVRNWEQGRYSPPAHVRTLLAVIATSPEVVDKALKSA